MAVLITNLSIRNLGEGSSLSVTISENRAGVRDIPMTASVKKAEGISVYDGNQ